MGIHSSAWTIIEFTSFFFQAEDGIRDYKVTGFRRVLFRSRLRTVLLGAVVFAISLLVTVTAKRVQLGVNLFTAEAVLATAATMMLLRTIRWLRQKQ